MFKITVKEVLQATGGKLISTVVKGSVCGISTDTRTIKPGDLFIAIRGENFDGHDFN